MRRLTTLALTAALTIGGAPAVLAQPGPPDQRPAAEHADSAGSPQTGQDRAGEHAQPQGSPQTGQDRAEDGRERASEHAEGQGSPATGEQASQQGRQRAAEASGMEELPARDRAREDGRAFGEQRAKDARERGDADERGGSDTRAETATARTAGVEVPDEAGQARGVLAGLAGALQQAFDVVKELFGITSA